MDSTINPFKPQTRRVRRPASFAEALLEIGGQVASETRKAAGDIAAGTIDSLVGNFPQASGELKPQQPIDPEAALREQEARLRAEQEELRRHQEVIQTTIYNREEEETKRQIEGLQAELKLLAEELAKAGMVVDKVVDEEIVEPGTYHVNFFVKMREFLIQLRKRVVESRNWMALTAQRAKSKNYFWGQVKRSGTKYLLSQERYMSTSGG
ncbi:hypothetical protein A3A66_02070 [Microgenomates group bacterium RIFCSPLOWO2_01_FULL_46_13]|nr:MAG: hypothetical protein A2783_01840 [Microgenomates group bacterium RIFCSPHIGHO2_01_FULL_45_11]OGV94763.1 MAG: hypothetical protein A3A66_02070 [Microgenomates group bacterium RIFCSPLOWO2_01_FULL_46_13]